MPLLPRLDDADPQARFAGAVALLVAASQPFYPLYLHAIAGSAAWPAWLVLLTTPAYAAIPWISRRHDRLARATLPVVGVVNTMVAVKALGTGSGVELFYLPCVLAAMAVTKPGEGGLAACLVAITAFAYFVAEAWLGTPLATFSPDESAAMVSMHAVSVGGLLAFSGYRLRPPPSG